VTTGTAPLIDHKSLESFASTRVNLPKSEVDQHRGQVERLREHLKRIIDAHETYALIKTVHSGSVAKGTALKSISDMDVAAYLDASLVPDGNESMVITELANILRAAYGATKDPTDFEEQVHSVKVHFHGSGLDVDVVPVIYNGLPDDRGDLITKGGEKVETSVRLHLEFIKRRKASHGTSYAQVVRFLKFWAREQRRVRGDEFRCKSFLLELLVAHLADEGLALDDHVAALEAVFAWLVRTSLAERVWFDDYYSEEDLLLTHDSIQVIDPVNPANNVCGTYSLTDRAALVDAAADALDAVTAARYGTTKGYAVDCWQEVFGPTFRGDQ